jgi:hypothetical protein
MIAQKTAEEVYAQVIKPLPIPERLKLATLILNDVPPQAVVDYSEEWTEEDINDLRVHSLRYAAQSFGEDEEQEGAASR